MTNGRTFHATGIVLRTRDLGEADRIAVIYSLERGKFSAVAKGSRRARSKLKSATQPFIYGIFFLAAGRNLHVLTQADVRDSFYVLHTDLRRLAHAAVMCELVERSVEEDHPDESVFALLLTSLQRLTGSAPPEQVELQFQLRFVSLLGYEPNLDDCVVCGDPARAAGIFSLFLGGVVCDRCRAKAGHSVPLAPEARFAMRQLLTGAENEDASEAVGEVPWDDHTHQQLRAIVTPFIAEKLDVRLRSLEFLRQLNGIE